MVLDQLWHLVRPPQPYALEVSNRVRAEEGKGNNKRGESPLSSSDPTDNDDNKDENVLSALTNAVDIDEEEEEEGEMTEDDETPNHGGDEPHAASVVAVDAAETVSSSS